MNNTTDPYFIYGVAQLSFFLSIAKHFFPIVNDLCHQKTNDIDWVILMIVGCFGVLSAFCIGKAKETTGTEMYLWFTGFLIAISISMLLLVKATQNLPIGTAYTVWTRIDAVGAMLIGILVFREPASFWRLFFIAMLISSIIELKMVSH